MRFAAAILASVAIHAALAALAVFGLSLSDNDDHTNIALDIGAVELSFAEKERDEMPIAPKRNRSSRPIMVQRYAKSGEKARSCQSLWKRSRAGILSDQPSRRARNRPAW